MTHDELLARLRAEIADAGSGLAWADANRVSTSVLSDVLNRRRDPTPSILMALGLERVVSYRPVAT